MDYIRYPLQMIKINLFFFLPYFVKGGAGNSIYKLCKNLNKKKYNINIICLNKCEYKKLFLKESIKVFEIKSSRTLFAINKIKKIILNNITKDKNIFVSNINYANLISLIFFKKIKNLKVICIERTPIKELDIYFDIKDYIKKNIIKFLLKIFYKRSDKIIRNSKIIKDQIFKKFKQKSLVIYPPSFDGKIIQHKSKKKNILTITRLEREKKIDLLINAMKLLKNHNIKLLICGTGSQEKYLKSLVNKYKINNKVKFLGYRHDAHKFYKKSFVYINTSYFEGFPNSVIESLSFSTPVISSQSHGGINEIINNKKLGIIINNINDSQLAKAIEFYSKKNHNQQLNKKYLFNHLNKFSKEKNIFYYDKLFSKI